MSSIADDRLNQIIAKKKEQEKFEEQMDYHRENHGRYGDGCGFVTRWSIYEGDSIFGVKYNGRMGEQSPFTPGTVIRNHCKVWGYDTSVVIGGKGLWCDVWLACDSAIRNAVDDEGNKDHHVFIEGFERMETGEYRIITGS